MKWGGGNPDIQIGENEIKLGDTEITSENVLPTPTNEDVGKVPTVQEDGSYALANTGGGGGVFEVHETEVQGDFGPLFELDKTYSEIEEAINSGKTVLIKNVPKDENDDEMTCSVVSVELISLGGLVAIYEGYVTAIKEFIPIHWGCSANNKAQMKSKYPRRALDESLAIEG